MKKILVTGGCGFIGSHLVEHLVELGYKVICFDKYNVDGYLYNLAHSKFKKDIEFILGDIRDFDSVKNACKNVDTIFHLAALVSIPYSYISPSAYIDTNLKGTYNILEASKDNDISDIIITSTSEVYGSALFTPMNEKHPLFAQSPYSATKIAADQLAISYYNSYNSRIKIIRPFNNFGPRQSSRAVIPTILSSIYSEDKYIKVGNVNAKRDYLFVKDTILAFQKLMLSKKYYGEIFNFGNGKSYKISEIINLSKKLSGSKKKIKIEKKRLRPKKSEVTNLVCDSSKAKKYLGWKPIYDLEKGLKITCDWYSENPIINNNFLHV